MKQLLTCLLSVAVLFASFGSAGGAYVPSESLQPSAQLLNRELYEDKGVETYQAVVGEDGAYLELSDFSMAREAGTTITVNGVWKPFHVELALEFYADDGTATLGFLRSGEYNVFHLNSSSTWHLRIWVTDGLGTADGTIQLTIA